MKTYGINPTQIDLSGYTVTGISLGEAGRGRKLVIVPTPSDGYMVPGLSKTGKPRLNPTTSDKGWVVRISTDGAYVRGANGNVSAHPKHADKIQVVAHGYGAFGLAGRTGTWDDVLLATELEEFLLRVKPSRGDAYLLLFKDGEVIQLSYEAADAIEIDYDSSTSTSRGDFVRLC